MRGAVVIGVAQVRLPRGSTLARSSERPSHVNRFITTSCMVVNAWIQTQILVPRLNSLDGPTQLDYGRRKESTMCRIDFSVLELFLKRDGIF